MHKNLGFGVGVFRTYYFFQRACIAVDVKFYFNYLYERYAYTYCAGQGWGLRCRCDFFDLSAVRFVYQYVI